MLDDKQRLANDLLDKIISIIPDSRGVHLYEKGIICPAEAISKILDELKEKFRDMS